jgi:hypothetical protein
MLTRTLYLPYWFALRILVSAVVNPVHEINGMADSLMFENKEKKILFARKKYDIFLKEHFMYGTYCIGTMTK